MSGLLAGQDELESPMLSQMDCPVALAIVLFVVHGYCAIPPPSIRTSKTHNCMYWARKLLGKCLEGLSRSFIWNLLTLSGQSLTEFTPWVTFTTLTGLQTS